ncbi:GumC family protein, partial [Prochlorothrix hollandica]|uniref:GumC family protein n=1 Tax=Prochlorothrix hollandica TaxID=1223 RepID=UPI0033420B7D
MQPQDSDSRNSFQNGQGQGADANARPHQPNTSSNPDPSFSPNGKARSETPGRRDRKRGNNPPNPGYFHPDPMGQSLGQPPVPMVPLSYYTTPPTPPDDDFDLKALWQTIRRRAWIVGSVATTVAAVTWGYTLTRSPIYQGSFNMLLGSPDEAKTAADIISPYQQTTTDITAQIEVLKSPSLLRPVYLNLQQTYPDLTYDELVANLRISNPQSEILNVSYQGTDPEQIGAILQATSTTYLAYSLQKQQDSLNQGIQFVDEQLPVVRDRVQAKQEELELFRQSYAIVDPEAKGSQLSTILATLQQQQRETQIELVEAQSQAAILQQQLGSSADIAITSAILSEAPHYQNVMAQIKTLQSQIAVESARFTNDSPQIQALVERRQNLEYLLQLEARKVLGSGGSANLNDHMTSIPLEFAHQLADLSVRTQVLQVRTQALQAVGQQLNQEFAQIPQLATQYENIKRELEIANSSLGRFLETRETLEIESAQKPVPWQLLSDPNVPSQPIAPNVPRNLLMGLLAGLGLGIGAGVLRDRFDHVVHSLDEVKTLTGMPVLGQIPYNSKLKQGVEQSQSGFTQMTSQPLAPALQSGGRSGFHSPASSYQSSPFLEAFRLLYTNLRFLQSDTPLMSLVVSSALPEDGKSTVSLYLAQAAAAMGQRVLLVDADMRRPQVHSRLGLPNLQGLSNILAHNIDPDQVIQVVGLNLSVLTVGQIPPDPTNLLSSNRMQFLIERFEASYDLVIYDTPPLLGLADASLLAAHLDGILLTVGVGKTDQSALKAVLSNLRVSNAPVLGVVANGLTESSQYTDRYYQY